MWGAHEQLPGTVGPAGEAGQTQTATLPLGGGRTSAQTELAAQTALRRAAGRAKESGVCCRCLAGWRHYSPRKGPRGSMAEVGVGEGRMAVCVWV